MLVMAFLEPARHVCGKRSCGMAGPTRRSRARSASAWGSMPRPPTIRRSPPSSRPIGFSMTSGSSRIWWQRRKTSRPGGGAAGAGRDDRGDPALPGPWRRQPQEHPGRAAGAGVPRCRVRLVRRPGVRSRVLPEPSAAEVPVDAARGARVPRLLRCARDELPRRRRLGAAAAVEARTARLLPGLFLGRVDGKSPVEYLTEERRQGAGAQGGAGAAGRPGRRGSAACARPGRGSSAREQRTAIADVQGRRVWDSRGRPTVEAEVRLAAAPGAARSRRPAPRPARARRSTSATAAPRSAASTSAAVAAVNDEIARRSAGLDASSSERSTDA